MTVFLIIAALLLLTTVFLVAYPLLRGRASRAEDPDGDVVRLSRQRLEELKQQQQNGDISDSEYAERVKDLEAQLSDDLHTGSSSTTGAPYGGRWVGIVAVVFIPVLSGLLYLSLGQPQALTPEERVAAQSPSAEDITPDDIDAMVARLAERLEDNPDDAEGWFMLGRSLMVLERYEEAANAFQSLRNVVGNEPDVMLRQATALAMQQGGSLGGKPIRLVRRALAERPGHPQALWMAATAAYQSGDTDTALEYYREVEPKVEGEQRQQVRGMIEQLAPEAGIDSNTSGTDGAAEQEAIQDTASGPALQVRVTLAPSLQDQAADQDTVFIFARAVNGPPMPLAVVRKTVADLPATVTLDDSRAMTPQAKLSGFDRVTVGARVSSSGEPVSQPGDLEGGSSPVATDSTETIEVTIDSLVAPEE